MIKAKGKRQKAKLIYLLLIICYLLLRPLPVFAQCGSHGTWDGVCCDYGNVNINPYFIEPASGCHLLCHEENFGGSVPYGPCSYCNPNVCVRNDGAGGCAGVCNWVCCQVGPTPPFPDCYPEIRPNDECPLSIQEDGTCKGNYAWFDPDFLGGRPRDVIPVKLIPGASTCYPRPWVEEPPAETNSCLPGCPPECVNSASSLSASNFLVVTISPAVFGSQLDQNNRNYMFEQIKSLVLLISIQLKTWLKLI